MTDFLIFYVRTFAVALPLIASAIMMIGVSRANLTGGQTGVTVTVAAFLFGLWFAIVVPPSESNVLNVPPTLQDPPNPYEHLWAARPLRHLLMCRLNQQHK